VLSAVVLAVGVIRPVCWQESVIPLAVATPALPETFYGHLALVFHFDA